MERDRGPSAAAEALLHATSPAPPRAVGADGVRALVSSFLGWMFDGFETSVLILVGSAAMVSLLPHPGPEDVRLAVGTALGSTLVGWAVGGTVGSVLADRIGRKTMMMVAIGGYCAFTALTALSPSAGAFIALRFLTGIFLGSEWSTGTALVAETWPDAKRAKALGVMQSGYGFGFFLAAGLWLVVEPHAGPDGWRWMFAVGVLPALVLIFIRREVAESKLWLDAVEAGAGQRSRGAGLSGMLADRGTIGRVIATLLMATVTVACFYGISAQVGPHVGAIAAERGLPVGAWASIGALVYNGGAILSYVAAGFIADAVGRKPYMYGMFSGAILSGLLVALAPPTLPVSLACAFVLGAFTLGIFSWMPIYLPELFPTRIRATASGVVFNLARLISFPMPILTASMFGRLGGFPAIAFALTLLNLVAIVALATLPETRGRSLAA